MKKIIGAALYFLALSGLALLFAPAQWWPSFYQPTFFGIVFLSSALVIILPKYFYPSSDECSERPVIVLRSALAGALSLNALGELSLYQLYLVGFQYDKLLHLISVAMLAAALTYFLRHRHNLPTPAAFKRVAILAVAGSLVWELFEYLSDLLFKTAEFGVYGQYKFADTSFDLLFDLLGIALAGFITYSRGPKAEKTACLPGLANKLPKMTAS